MTSYSRGQFNRSSIIWNLLISNVFVVLTRVPQQKWACDRCSANRTTHLEKAERQSVDPRPDLTYLICL